MGNRAMSRDKAVTMLLNRIVWHIYCGSSTGSVIDIHFAPAITRKRRLSNTSVEEFARTNQGEVSLMVHSSWRLEHENDLLAGAGDAFDDAPDVFTAIRGIVGDEIVGVDFPTLPIHDLILRFKSGRSLRVFCDRRHGNCDDYTLFYGEVPLGVSGGKLNEAEWGEVDLGAAKGVS